MVHMTSEEASVDNTVNDTHEDKVSNMNCQYIKVIIAGVAKMSGHVSQPSRRRVVPIK